MKSSKDLHTDILNIGDWYKANPLLFDYAYSDIYPALRFEKKVKRRKIYPEAQNLYKAFQECTPSNIKVVILGQDPYHDGSATGKAFENNGRRTPSPSLQNIYKEFMDDVGELEQRPVEEACNIGSWSSQGVLLLNTALTVVKGHPTSHMKLWEPWTTALIDYLNTIDDIVWVMWGSKAQAWKKRITNSTHHFIETSHPSPLGATKTDKPFLGSKCFSRINKILESIDKEPIKWDGISSP